MNQKKTEVDAGAEVVNELVKVRAIYQADGLAITLWGVDFVKEGGDFVATLSKIDADLMVESGRVEII